MTARIALTLLFAVPAVLAYPWPDPADRGLLGVAVAVAVAALARWRGQWLSAVPARRLALWRRNRGARRPVPAPDERTVLLRLDPADDRAEVPLAVLTGYLDRFGVRCHAVRVTSRDVAGERTTWIGLTIRAADNLAALAARGPQLPLAETASVTVRRLADHLRELGWTVTVEDDPDAVAPAHPGGTETWRGVRGETGYTAAYTVTVDDRLPGTLAAVWTAPGRETWTSLQFSGTRAAPAVAVACALNSPDKPAARAPLPGLTPHHGGHGPALDALDPRGGRAAARPVPLRPELLDALRWPLTAPAQDRAEQPAAAS